MGGGLASILNRRKQENALYRDGGKPGDATGLPTLERGPVFNSNIGGGLHMPRHGKNYNYSMPPTFGSREQPHMNAGGLGSGLPPTKKTFGMAGERVGGLFSRDKRTHARQNY